jgi:site-specific DNA-methyltransferase (adenine-specific)
MSTHHRIIIGDSRDMSEVEDASVHLVVTSPPYWQLKDYGEAGQIGFNDTYEEYINNLNLVWKECHRVLHTGCRLCVNIGDQFARSAYYGRYKVIPIRTEITRFCETTGFDYMGAIIWQKLTTCNTTGGATIMGSFPYPRNGILKIDYEFILIFKKNGKPPKVDRETKEKSRLSTEEWNEYFAGHWNFAGEKQDKHLAMFPEELPRRLIRMFTFVGDTVLDPFLGSGSTSLAAKNQERNSVGYESNQEFLPIMENKLGMGEQTLFRDAEFEVIKSTSSKTDFSDEIQKLPYLFRDPILFDKKVDPKKLRYGSRIDKDPRKDRETYHRVKEVLSPDTLILDNGLRIRLIGIRERAETRQEAIDFLYEKTQSQRVFLKYDEEEHDEDEVLPCYLYLQNKTFVNLHLVRTGFVDVDISTDFSRKGRFLRARKEATHGRQADQAS